MRRLAGSRLGALVSLSVVLSMGTATGLSSSASATRADAPDAPGAAATRSADPVKPSIKPLSAARAKAARSVELPRPVRGNTAIRLLDDQLDEAAALNDLSEARLVELLRTDATVWLDSDGNVFFKDETAVAPAVDPVSAAAPLDQTFLLHSKPGSTRTIYLDFDGGTASGTAWHQNYPATPTTQPAWDLSGNPAVFDDAERTAIQTVWQMVAEDYAPFDVDVTTADPGAAGIFRTNAADLSFGSHVLITPSDPSHDAICGGCGGVAYLGVFDTVNGNGYGAAGDGYGSMQPAWVFPQKLGNSPKNIAEAVSHEVGHNFGLSHDGNATQGYDQGHGSWAPIMGVGYYHPLSQWSKGDYAGANNNEDDVDVIRDVTGGRLDEASSGIAGAPALPTGTAYVSRRTDVDTYLLGTCSGSVTVNATAPEFANGDLKVSILNPAGTVMASADPASAQTSTSAATGLSATVTQTLSAGTYYVSVDGVGNGPWSTGYDDYGSLGAYTLAVAGSCNGATPAGSPSAPTSLTATPHATDPTVSITWAAPASAGSSAVTGYVLEHSGTDVPVQVGPTATSYTWTGLDPATAYSFTVTALNAQGAGPAATVSAGTPATAPSVPQGITGSWDSLSQSGRLGWRAPARRGGYPVTSYQVFVNGTLLGSTLSSTNGVTLSPFSPGTYTLGVSATNQAGRGPIGTVSLVVPAKPANDSFAQRTTMSGVSGTVAGDTAEATAEANEPAPTATRPSPGGASVWYSWTAPADGPVTMTTTSSVTDRDTTLDVYTGTTVGGLVRVVGNDEPGGASHLAAVSFTATAGTTYALAVNGYRTFATGVGPFSLSWTGTAPAPAAVTTTTLGSVVTGRSATLTATVTAPASQPAGNVQFHDGGVLVGTQAVASGTASVVLSDLVRGDHSYRATFVPSNSALFTTSQSSVVTSTIAATTTGTTLTATGGVNTVNLAAAVTAAAGTATGTVQFKEGATDVGSATVSGGNASMVLTGVSAGNHTYTATFVPADTQRYDGSTSAPRSATVENPPPAKVTTTGLSATPTGRSVALTATVTTASGTPAGTIQFRDGSTVLATVALASGTASTTVNDLLRGTHHFTAEFVPTDAAAYASSQSNDSVVEIAATPTTTSLTTSVNGRTVTLTTSVSPTVAGTVRFNDGPTLVGTVTLAAGAGQLTLADVPAGDHPYTASFVPADDLRHAPSTSAPTTQTVLATPTQTALGSSVVNHQVTLTATITSGAGSPGGSVEFREGGSVVATKAVTAGTATAVLDDVPTGSHSYTATFVPSAPTSYASSVSSAQNVTVVATATATDLTASNSGRTVTLTATTTGSGTPAGSVEFREGASVVGTVPLGAGSTVLTLTSVSPGSHAYTATFVPSGTSHAASTSPLRSVTVRVSSTTALTAGAAGRDVTLDVQVTTDGGTPTGSVELRDGSLLIGTRPVASGTASLTITNVAPGDHSYTATFVPSDTAAYTGSVSTARLVNVAKVATSTALAASATGQTVTLTATPTATSGTVTGSVDFWEGTTYLGNVPLSSGSAVRTLSNVAPGDHTYSATFVPTGTFHSGSMSPDRMVTVAKIATSTALTTSVSGRAVTLTATASTTSGTLTGDVVFRDGTTPVGTVQLSGGSAVLELTGVAPGSHDYTATFVPSGTSHTGSTSPVATATVAKVITTTDLTASVSGRSVTLTSTTTPTSGAPAGDVVFRDGTAVLGTVPLAAGSAVLELTGVAPGSHGYTATFVPSDTIHAGSLSPTRTRTVQVSSTTELAASTSGRDVTLAVQVTTDGGSPAGTIQFSEGGQVIDTKPVTAGAATLTLTDVAPGAHTYRATFVPTDTASYTGSGSPERTVTVARIATETALNAEVTGRTVTLRATPTATSGTLTGDVEFHEGTTLLGTVALSGGNAVLVLADVAPGDHDYTATFVPTGTSHTGSTSQTVTAPVGRITTDTALAAEVSGQDVTLTATPTTTSGTVTGDVEFREGTTLLDTVPLSGASAVLELVDVAPGQHTYTATFVPTGTTHTGSMSARDVTVEKIATDTALSADVSGRTVTLTATPTTAIGTLDGAVEFREGDSLLDTVDLSDGDAVLTLSDVAPGDHAYTATFVPTGTRFAGSMSSPSQVTVARIATDTALSADVTGRTVTLTATPSTTSGILTGSVEFTEGTRLLDTVLLTDGTALLELTGVDPGEHNYRATFVPTGTSHTGSTSPIATASVDLIETTTDLAVDVTGRAVTLTATPTATSGTPAGQVELRADGDVIGTLDLVSGTATTTLTNVQPGEHTYSARFVPSDASRFTGSSAEQTVQVARVATDTTLTISVDERTVTLTAHVTTTSGSLSGDVEFHDEYGNVLATEALTDGGAVATIEHVDPGERTYTATFVPSGSFHAESTSAAKTVTVSNAVTTTTDLEVSVVGRTVSVEATVSSREGTPTGEIEFRDGDTLLEPTSLLLTDGRVGWEFDHVSAGTHHYTATYVPSSGDFKPSSSPIRTFDIAQTGTTTTLTASADGAAVTLAATITSETGWAGSYGRLELREGNTLIETYGVWAAGQEVVHTIPDVLGGSHTYTATYISDSGDFATSNASATVAVARTSTAVGLSATKAGRKVTLTSPVTSPIGSPAGTVSFLDGGVVVGAANVAGGSASLVLTGVASGSHDYTASFAPTQDSRYAGSSSVVRNVTLTPSTTTTTLAATAGASSVSFDAHIVSADGSPTGTVVITENGSQVGFALIDNGRATYELTSVATGSHTYVAIYGYDGAGAQFATSASQPVTLQVSTVAPAATTTTGLTADATRRTVSLQAAVTSAAGTPTGSVQFAQDGVAIDSVALTNGTASLSRSAVAAGAHTYTATYVPASAAFASSTSPTRSVTVARTVTTTALTGSVNGSTVTLDLGVAGTDGIVPVGQVRVLSGTTEVGTVQLSGGTATLVLASVEAGPHGYRAVFDGSADLAESSSATLELTVAAPPAPPTTTPPATTPPTTTPPPANTVSSSTTKVVAPKKAKVGSRPVIKISVMRGVVSAAGKVVVTVGKKKTTLTLKAGAAKLKLPKLKKGKLKITVRYSGDASTAASSASFTIKGTP